MSTFSPLIISASAGTGKTYRLALEYVRLILQYYGYQEFKPDNILVLTFTRKATAEIRERIQKHLELLCSANPDDAKKQRDLILSLKGDGADADPTLTIEEKETLRSALRDILHDRRMLQVMTLDSYINSIFRNIVRPLRNLGDFSLDTEAIAKRMPYLLDHLMTRQMKDKVDRLLRRKVSSSLDKYRKFFASLIDNRWLYYLIRHQASSAREGTLLQRYTNPDAERAAAALNALTDDISEIIRIIDTHCQTKGQKLGDCVNSGFRSLFTPFPESADDLIRLTRELCQDPPSAHKLYSRISKDNLHNGGKITAKSDAGQRALELLKAVRTHLANYLLDTLFLPEQLEIMEIWEAILNEYDQLIYKYKNMTYNDIAWFSLAALFSDDPPVFRYEDENIASEFYQFLTHRSRFVLIDEFQDTSLMQFGILKPIINEVSAGEGTKPFGGLIVVGDEKQSIFGWRGGERELLVNLDKVFPNMSNIRKDNLTASYRSTPRIMEFVNRVFSDASLHRELNQRNLQWSYSEISSAVPDEDALSEVELSCLPYQYSGSENSRLSIMRDWVQNTICPPLTGKAEESVAIICRTGNELSQIQDLLDASGVPSIYQPSSTLDEHPLISPLLAWLRWLAWRDWADWLAFLRSDYLLIKAKPLKDVLMEIKAASNAEEPRQPDFSFLPVVQHLYLMSQEIPHSVSAICRELTRMFLPDLNLTERDNLNVQAFLKITGDFDLNPSQAAKSIPDFLQYIQDNRTQDFMKQMTVEGRDTLQLLTIHKSKGLQFDRVFVLYDLSARHGNDAGSLSWYTQFPTGVYDSLQDYAFTYHYNDILKGSDFRHLHELSINREILEELNNLYVAFTRAKTKLHILFTYQGSKGWDEYLNGKEDEEKLKLPMLLCNACQGYFMERNILATDHWVISGAVDPDTPLPAKEADAESIKTGDNSPGITAANLAANIWQGTLELPIPKADTPHYDIKKSWLEDKSNLRGDMAHFYLSYIIRNTEAERHQATQKCLHRYGSLVPHDDILSLCNAVIANLPRLNHLFEPRWDKVFTEQVIYLHGREYRIDRLMLDSKAKTAYIADYKTGSTKEQDQLDTYLDALQALPYIRDNGYSIETGFVNLKL